MQTLTTKKGVLLQKFSTNILPPNHSLLFSWTKNVQMYKLGLEKAEEPEIKLPTFVGSQRKQGNSRKNIYFCFINYTKAFDCVDHNKLCKILKEMGTPDHLTCLLRKLYGGQEATVRTRHETTEWFTVKKGVCQDCMLSAFLFNICKVHHAKCQAGWSSSWSRLLWEISIISDMQMTPPYGRNLRRTKEPLDEGERGECKSWLTTQH